MDPVETGGGGEGEEGIAICEHTILKRSIMAARYPPHDVN